MEGTSHESEESDEKLSADSGDRAAKVEDVETDADGDSFFGASDSEDIEDFDDDTGITGKTKTS